MKEVNMRDMEEELGGFVRLGVIYGRWEGDMRKIGVKRGKCEEDCGEVGEVWKRLEWSGLIFFFSIYII